MPEISRTAIGDVTVVVPVRIDSPDRLRNLDLALSWLTRWFDGQQTLVLEHDSAARATEVAARYGAEHLFIHSDGCFHKSRVFNLGVALAERPIVLLYDCDVLVPAAAVEQAVKAVRRDEADYVYPYNGVMLELRCSDTDARALLHAPAFGAAAALGDAREKPPPGATHLNGSVAAPSTGGALACKRRTLLLHGGFNPNIVSYGCEDTELETRVRKLGARVARVAGYNCFHVHHRRGPDSRYNGLHAANLAEWKKVEAMSPADTAAYVENGFRSLVLDPAHSIEVIDTPERFSLRVAPAEGRSLGDTAILVMLDADPALPVGLVASLIDAIEREYSGYEIHLVERDGYRYRPVSHRDHVIYQPVREEPDLALLERLIGEVECSHLCVCSVFVDTRVERLGEAIEKLRADSAAAVEVPASEDAGGGDPRTARVVGVLRARAGSRARSFAISRSQLRAWLARAPASVADSRWDVLLAAACNDRSGNEP